jgi:hypothetical protein
MNIKLFESWLTEETEATNPSPSWSKPVVANVSKIIKNNKQNLIQVKNKNGVVHNYSIVGIAAIGGKKHDINFQKLEKTDDHGLKLYRYVDKGTEPYEVDFDELKELLPKLVAGEPQAMSDGFLGDIYFTKI